MRLLSRLDERLCYVIVKQLVFNLHQLNLSLIRAAVALPVFVDVEYGKEVMVTSMNKPLSGPFSASISQLVTLMAGRADYGILQLKTNFGGIAVC